jgi:hypothetical protein
MNDFITTGYQVSSYAKVVLDFLSPPLFLWLLLTVSKSLARPTFMILCLGLALQILELIVSIYLQLSSLISFDSTAPLYFVCSLLRVLSMLFLCVGVLAAGIKYRREGAQRVRV